MMEGCCRNYKTMKSLFRGYRVIAVDSSQAMLDYGKKHFGIQEKDTICTRIQDFPYPVFEKSVSLCVCWWNLCYLPDNQLRRYLLDMLTTLKCPTPEMFTAS